MGAHALAGHLSVEESAQLIRHYRYAEERMMRIMGGWIALTPELSAKLLLGRHVWDCAQHADLWGKRLPELRAPAQVSEPPNETFVRFMDLMESPEEFHETPERLVGIYGVLKPHLLSTYEDHLARTNAVYEPPTRRILHRTADEERRHTAAGQVVLSHLLKAPELSARARGWQGRLEALLRDAGGLTGGVAGSLRMSDVAPDPSGVAQDLVELERPIGEWPMSRELKAAVESHVRHLLRRDYEAVEQHLNPGYREAGMTVYRALPSAELTSHRIVGLAELGGHRIVKVLLEGSTGAAVLQLRWGSRDGRWQVLEADVVRARAISGS